MSSTQAFIDEAAKIYKVLSNSTRLNILYYLRHYDGEADVKTIVNDLHLAQPIVSKQLGILYRYQLVSRHKEGTRVYYALDDPHVIEMIDDMNSIGIGKDEALKILDDARIEYFKD